MTMLFTHQPSAIHVFDQNACNRSTTFHAASVKKPAPVQYHTSSSIEARQSLVETRPSKPTLDLSASLVMPCPKKAVVLCSNAFLGAAASNNSVGLPVMTSPSSHWGLSSVLEDTPELETTLTTVPVAESDEDHCFEQAACAELMEIMSSSGSSCSSSTSCSPQLSLNDDVESTFPTESTVPFGLFEEHAAFFGSSPIIRANNPLPNDQSFRPSHPEPAAAASSEVTQHFQSFLARHRHQAKVFDFNLNVDETGEMQSPTRTNFNCIGVMF